MSVAIAFTVGIIGLSGIVADALQVDRGLLAWIASIDLENFGFIIVGLVLGTWLVSFAIWKLGRVDSLTVPPPGP
jgi:high-affinity nickel-transport protein